jgi:hypothetical protein
LILLQVILITLFLNLNRMTSDRISVVARRLQENSVTAVEVLPNSSLALALPVPGSVHSPVISSRPRILIGIMATDSTPASRINAIRAAFNALDASKADFEHYFLVGKPADGKEVHFGADVIRMDAMDNINEGKTWTWFNTALQRSGQLDLNSRNMIFKMDTDVALNLSRLDDEISKLSASSYMGLMTVHEMCGGFGHCPPAGCSSFEGHCWVYMSGGFYGLSLDLVELLMNCQYAAQNTNGYEDLMVGLWLKNCMSERRVNIATYDRGYLYCHSSTLTDDSIQNSKYEDCVK